LKKLKDVPIITALKTALIHSEIRNGKVCLKKRTPKIFRRIALVGISHFGALLMEHHSRKTAPQDESAHE
jgi:hypothetical protein